MIMKVTNKQLRNIISEAIIIAEANQRSDFQLSSYKQVQKAKQDLLKALPENFKIITKRLDSYNKYPHWAVICSNESDGTIESVVYFQSQTRKSAATNVYYNVYVIDGPLLDQMRNNFRNEVKPGWNIYASRGHWCRTSKEIVDAVLLGIPQKPQQESPKSEETDDSGAWFHGG